LQIKVVQQHAGACYIAHMRHRLRLLLLCLLIVSLPVQSIAAVVTIECGMAHDSPVLDAAAPSDHAHDAGHEHAAATVDMDSADAGCEDGSHHRSGCGSCTGCCLGAYAPPPELAPTAVEEAASGAQQFSLSPFSGHIPARIERPPRGR
jgi:hypothetical protein